LGRYIQIAAGDYQACALRTDHTAICWGDDTFGEGDVPAAPFAAAYATDQYDNCGIRTDGTWTCWGSSARGNTLFDDNAFYKPQFPGRLRQMDRGPEGGFCALRLNWTAKCLSAIEPSPPGAFLSISPAGDAVCGIHKTARTISCWDDPWTPLLKVPNGRFTYVGTGLGGPGTNYAFACAIRVNRTLACWGDMPGPTPPGRFKQVSVGQYGACAVRADGRMMCWGPGCPQDYGGCLPSMPETRPSAAHRAQPSLNPWYGLRGRYIEAAWGGNGPFCGLRTNHTILCAGSTGTEPWVGHEYTSVSVGYGADEGQNYNANGDVCAVGLTGETYCWGIGSGITVIDPAASGG
jgi:hypothetical protein